MKKNDTIAVLDFGGPYTHLIANRLRQLGVFSEIHSPSTDAKNLSEVQGIIYSGSTDDTSKIPQYNPEIFSIPVPKLGISYGYQLLAKELGAKIVQKSTDSSEIDGLKFEGNKDYGVSKLSITHPDHPLLKGITDSNVWMDTSHNVLLSENLKSFAHTSKTPHAIIINDSLKTYGVAFHPELAHTSFGNQIFSNFLDICKVQKSWNMRNYLDLISKKIITQTQNKNVFLLVSGGVDSTVAFVLLNKILGPSRVLGLHIDSGMMRLGESQKVLNFLEAEGMKNLQVCDASEEFLEALQGITAPEEKRKIIGATFLKIKDREMERLHLDPSQWIIAQGTIYPDILESGDSDKSNLVKTHHNRVQEVLNLMDQGLLIEPLMDLYKDEVRVLGEELGIPHSLVWRHPFPGPGLGVRLLCSTGQNHLPSAEQIPKLSSYLKENKIQGYLLPIQSVGVQTHGRTYAQPFLITSKHQDWSELELLASNLLKEFKEINRIVYQIGSINAEEPVLIEQYTTKNTLDSLRLFDDKATQFLEENNLYQDIWQMPVVQVPLQIQNKACIVMRPIHSSDAITAKFAPIDFNLLEPFWLQMKSIGAGALWYDITHKPPGTIEWE
ncbi:MAG: glutamine-hydrolyzing GMP synthase [Fibrobacter sp.]|nr:glutamine-hydrolyzing GMP synthase [Fibrobacter sp.]